MKILVTGGAGYIGSITVKTLQEAGHEPIVFDNLSVGHREAVACPLIVGDLLQKKDLTEAFAFQPEAVFHFAAATEAGLSTREPARFFENNATGSLNLLMAMAEKKVKYLIFSSTSEVYGEAQTLPITESHPLQPVNPYGQSKLMTEQMLPWFDSAAGIRSVSLRYFNAAGAWPDGSLGDAKHPSTLLISSAIKGALGLQPFSFTFAPVSTPDGSTIRDYVHVMDLADGHLAALEYLMNGGKSDFFNLGSGKGYSTLEMVQKVKQVTGHDFKTTRGKPRDNEPAEKYASFQKAKKLLGWRPKRDLMEIIRSAHIWHKSHPKGWTSA